MKVMMGTSGKSPGTSGKGDPRPGGGLDWLPSTLWQEYQWFIIAGIWLVALILGYAGFDHHLRGEASPLRIFYLTLQLFVLESGDVVKGDLVWQLETARLLAPAVAMYTAIKALATIFYEQLQLIRLRFVNDHIVICGLGRMGSLLAEAYSEQDEQVVVIEKYRDNENLRAFRDRGIITLIGDSMDPVVLRRAKIDVAKAIIAGTGDDSLNAEVAWQARDILINVRRKPLTCYMHIAGNPIFDLLKEHPVMTSEDTESFVLCPFNIHSKGAQLILDTYPPFGWETKELPGDKHPSVMILGLGKFGQALAMEMSTRWRILFPYKKLKLYVVDKVASVQVEMLKHRYPLVGEACDLEVINCDFESEEFQQADFLFENGRTRISSMFICIDNDMLGLLSALALHKKMEDDVPIIIRTNEDMGLTRLINAASVRENKNLYPFELLRESCKPEMLGHLNEKLAISLHESWLAQMDAANESTTADVTMNPWRELPEVTRSSNRQQAYAVPRILSIAGFQVVPVDTPNRQKAVLSDEDIEKIAELDHEQMVVNRKLDGWKHGNRDHDKKTSPTLVEWDKLDSVGQGKSRTWVRHIPDAVAKVGFMICKRDW